jgi:hypothetical protein
VPPIALPPDLQQAIMSFAERGPRLSAQRRVELADTLRPVTGQGGAEAEQTLLGYANWLVRGRETTS